MWNVQLLDIWKPRSVILAVISLRSIVLERNLSQTLIRLQSFPIWLELILSFQNQFPCTNLSLLSMTFYLNVTSWWYLEEIGLMVFRCRATKQCVATEQKVLMTTDYLARWKRSIDRCNRGQFRGLLPNMKGYFVVVLFQLLAMP